MKITLAVLALAIGLCRPSLPTATRTAYAKIVLDRSAKLGVDPILLIAIPDHESGWLAFAVSKDGEDYGLGQIRARYRPACAKDVDPVHVPSTACAAEKKKLLDGEHNLEVMADAIGAWIMVLKKKTGSERVSEEQWLKAYAMGFRKISTKATAGGSGAWKSPSSTIPSVVKAFLARRRALEVKLGLPPHPALS